MDNKDSFLSSPSECVDIQSDDVAFCTCEQYQDGHGQEKARCVGELHQIPLRISGYSCDKKNRRRKRSLGDNDVKQEDSSIDDADLFKEVVPASGLITGGLDWEKPPGRQVTEDVAMEVCTQTIENAKAYADCLPHVNMDMSMNECLIDVYVSTVHS